MHGRLKVKSTAEQQEAKRKEREKKLKVYNAATSRIFNKRAKGELDEELLTLTGEVLSVNPDFFTLWNIRKETFLEMAKTSEESKMQAKFQTELFFLEACLKHNPKGYGSWHHRCFVLDTMPEPDWGRELKLCDQFLQYDERNFHCWDYRRFVVQRAGVPAKQELAFSLAKISSNMSNYSSWHYRSKLLPKVHPDSSQPSGVAESALLKEYELVQNGIFTDPDDQSNWFYHRWLMGRGSPKQELRLCFVSRAKHCLMLSFNLPVCIGPRTTVEIINNGNVIDGLNWFNQDKDDTFSTLWISDLTLPPNDECLIEVKVHQQSDESVLSSSIELKNGKESAVSCSDSTNNISNHFMRELSPACCERLQQELESVTQLMEVETDNKWALLTAVLLMRAIDVKAHWQAIHDHLATLATLDCKRARYYSDLRSKLVVESAMTSSDLTLLGSELSFASKKLTCLPHVEMMPLVVSLDLKNNCLTALPRMGYLYCLEQLDLSQNEISSPDSLKPLSFCPNLKTLNIKGNPVCSEPENIDEIKKLLPGVSKLITSGEE